MFVRLVNQCVVEVRAEEGGCWISKSWFDLGVDKVVFGVFALCMLYQNIWDFGRDLGS